ncbi:LTA synthase family protein [Clostridium chauvoei]|uniref:LTA synthase family protein n=1 Tax=Clostridium chauvoei TaxID=46867 RepID=UPI00207A44CC|nr:LTA synthase family protein [Clostridium chauvoei]
MKKEIAENFCKQSLINLVFFIILSIKTIIFMSLIWSYNGLSLKKFELNKELILAYMLMIIIIIVPSLYFKGKGALKYLITIDILYSILLVADIVYFRATRNFLGFRNIFFNELTDPAKAFKLKFILIDLIFLIDLPLAVLALKLKSIKVTRRFIVIPTVIIFISFITVYNVHQEVDILDNTKINFMDIQWNPAETTKNTLPLGFHVFEGINTFKKVTNKPNEQDFKKVDNWLKWNNENLPANEYKAMAEGKNVIFVQFESLENFVINKKIYGQEITPNINRLIKEGLYFFNIYEQNNGGNSVDCDFMVNTSVLPLGDSITFLTHPEGKYPSLPRILKKEGYDLSTAHVVSSSDYNWAENHVNALGFENVWDNSKFNIKEKVGGYYSDREYLEQYTEKLTELKEPFYSMVATASSHGPFETQDEFKYLNLPKELNENRLGEYFQSIHYTDVQIGMFVEKLEALGLLDNTVIVLYGDHGGVHKYYSSMIENAPLEGDFWKEDTEQIPFVIYSKGVKPNVVDKNGGQVDIMPTVLYLLGIDYENLMGRNLLNTNRNATIMNNREHNKVIKGEPQNEEERIRLEEAYDIGEIIIKNRYYEKRDFVE